MEMELLGVRVEMPANAPVVLLRETEGKRRLLPIYIGGPEAASIAYVLEGVTHPRPLTHDLVRNLLTELGATLERFVITEMREHTYYAELRINVGTKEHVISSRPSDAIAIAVRTGTSIFAEEALLDEVGQLPPPELAPDTGQEASGELVDEFHRFIESVRPEDFGT